MDIAIKFGKKVVKIRLDRGMSQGDLAKIMEVGPSYISKIERGEQNLSLSGIEKLAKALGVRVDELLK
jgi:transcriptional regulator with XRE-family HTH domain